jgi:hypothetical protein
MQVALGDTPTSGSFQRNRPGFERLRSADVQDRPIAAEARRRAIVDLLALRCTSKATTHYASEPVASCSANKYTFVWI